MERNSTHYQSSQSRRSALRLIGGTVGAVGATPVMAALRRAMAAITEGPFYPSPAYRAQRIDWDADLTTVRSANAPPARARGEYLDLYGTVVDPDGRAIDQAEVEIWQCDVDGSYRHPQGAGARVDAGFQGFGSLRSDAQGGYRFRTIRPVPYSGRTPHIHVKLRHPSFGELTSQLFVAGEPGNPRDFLYRSLSAEQLATVEMKLQRTPAGSATTWYAEQPLVVGR